VAANLVLRIAWLKKNLVRVLKKPHQWIANRFIAIFVITVILPSNHTYQTNLSVGQQSKIKMGGLLALQEIINHSSSEKISDIFELVKMVKKEYKNFESIPFSQLMPKITQFKFRKKPSK